MQSDTTDDLQDKTLSNLESEQELVSNPLHELQVEISQMPDVDPERVRSVIAKIQNGNFDMLGSAEDKLACAERIAQLIIDETQNN